MRISKIAVCLFVIVVAVSATAQETLDWPTGEFQPYSLDSGTLANPGTLEAVVSSHVIHVEDAVWLRLYFEQVKLPAGSFVRMTSTFDNEVQELDAAGLAMWHNTSAYFNGDTVILDIVAGPGTTDIQIVLERVATQIVAGGLRGPCADDDCGICGSDNRVLSNENWSGRLMPVGCTGSIIDTESCVVSAGHCAAGNYDDVIQFNVPASSSNCYPYNPPAADQFPITSHLYLSNGVGADWSVMTTGTNNYGEKPYDRYGEFRPIATTLGSSGNAVAVWGFGVDNGDPTRSQDQQTSGGVIGTRYSTYYTYTVDVTYGNSGSALIRNDEIIGIVTHCSFNCANIATRVDLSAFETAREQLCGGGGGYCAASSSSTSYEYISNVTLGDIDHDSGASSYSDFTAYSTEVIRGQGHAFSLTIGTPYSSDIGGLWIDWNQDEDFSDSSETITTAWTGNGPYTTTVNVPSWATLGETRLRVRIQDGNYDDTLSPCGTTSYGEVEDYTVIVTEDQVMYTLTTLTSGQGDILLNPPGPSYPSGTNVQVTADADPGWHFDHWEIDLSGSTNPTYIYMNGNKTVRAVFYEDIADCNGNGIDDAVDLANCDGSPWCSDCNNNGVLDVCDIAGGSADCQPDGIPDECQLGVNDCNENGVPDDCDILMGAPDCQPDGIPDECQLGENDC
ncbi:MAG: GEVED domain-containing protein, partial [Planctomycetota bacterium]